MLIDIDLLFAWGANSKKYAKNEYIFRSEEHARFYYQLISGTIKMLNISEEGKEFVQGFFTAGESFGEPPLFLDKKYPASALTAEDSVVIRLPKENFDGILTEYPEIQAAFTKLFAERIYQKTTNFENIIQNSPEKRLLVFLEGYKKKYAKNLLEKIQIHYTRQEIADLLGLRVETVIRALSKMNKENKVSIKNKKLYF